MTSPIKRKTGGEEMPIIWWTRNEYGFWCNFCGNCLKPEFHFDSDDEWDEYEGELNDRNCDQCGAPDEFDQEAI